MQRLGRGTGKLQRKLQARRLPLSRTGQGTGENPLQKQHTDTRYWKINLELCSESHSISFQENQQQGLTASFENTLKFGVNQRVM